MTHCSEQFSTNRRHFWIDSLERNSLNQPKRAYKMEIQDAVLQIQANADSERTLKTYKACMRQLESYLNRCIYSMELFDCDDERHESISPVTMPELLRFLEHKRQNASLSKSTAQGFKSAVAKFRQRNGFAKFSSTDESSFTRYRRGLSNVISQAIRDGTVDGDEGKRHLKREELEFLCSFAVEEYEFLSSFKYGTEVHLFLLLSWSLCARSETAAFIHASHLDWEGDCLKIGIAKSKRNYNTTFSHLWTL